MSWYLFRDAPAVRTRGIKVDGFQQWPLHRPKINLSWGMNEGPSVTPPTPAPPDNIILPATINTKYRPVDEALSNVKVLTETSEDDTEELIKLIKRRQANKKDLIEQQNNAKVRSQSLNSNQYVANRQSSLNEDFTKRMRYLENSLLPNCRRDSMDTILDYGLSKQVPLSDSRISSKSNRKNESNVILGDGFNVFMPPYEPKKELTKQLQDIYDYEEQRNKRAALGSFALG